LHITAPKNKWQLFYRSLRGKFQLAFVLVAIILILSSTASYIYISQSSKSATIVLQQRLEKLNETRIIMDNVWDVSLYLEEHSMAPSLSTRNLIFSKMVASVNRLLYLIEMEEGNAQAIVTLESALNDLGGLGIYINQLLELRASPAKLFPAIEISRSAMFEHQNLFSHLVGLSIDEAVVSLADINSDVLLALTKLRYQWVQMVSFYRMYLVNRLALMDPDSLALQIDNIDLFVSSINKSISSLKAKDENGLLEFQASEALPQLEQSFQIWLKSFREIVSTDTPEEWRSDYPVIKNKIAPHMKSIWETIYNYNHNIELDVKNSLNDLSGVARNTSYLLWGLTVFGLSVMVVLFYFIRRIILQPIQTLSKAMREEAHDGRYLKPLLLRAKSLEIENLIDAFSSMQLQVHCRKNDLEHQALHDTLTGLPNRLLLFDRLQQAITKEKRARGSLSLIMMDLDRFKEINDTLGHHAGDQLLTIISTRLNKCLRDADTVARLGGDEFAILIPDCDAEKSKNIAMKIRDCMQPAIQLYEQSLYIQGSLGVAIYPDHGTDAEMLLKNADIAMYVSKRNNSVYEMYDIKQDQHSVNRLALKHKLQKALEEKEFQLYFQPQINCRTMKIVGVEALLRWNSPGEGLIAPDIFIPLAEESGLIKGLTEWVISDATHQQKLWKKNGLSMHVSINLSAWNLLDPDLDKFVLKHFEEHEVEKGRISFEITESVMMTDTEQALKMMSSLNEIGSDIIVDDYGTGFSSLAYLKRFPVNELKIDKSFVLNMIANENDAVIVKSTIDMAHNLGLKVVAEGVESRDVFDVLQMLGCDMVQGYFIARPMTAENLSEWCANYRPSRFN